VLALHFENPADYEKVRETDRLSILGLTDLAPDSSVRIVLHHEDRSEEVVPTRHTMNDDQIAWFKAGSALNLLRQGG
jgi:aconitate hydratase